MRTLLLVFAASLSLVVTTFVLPADQAAQAKKTDAEKLIGTWRAVQGRYEGEDWPKELLSLIRLRFHKEVGSQFSVGNAGRHFHNDFKISGASEIELELFFISDREPGPALYKLDEKDRLTICTNSDAKRPRPTDYSADKGSGHILLTFERAKPGQETLSNDEVAKLSEAFHKLKGFERLREKVGRWESTSSMHHLGVGFHVYLDVKRGKHFPAHAIYSKDGKTPLLSWRVTLLDYLEESDLRAKEFRLDEPWDSEHNKKLIPKMPSVYAGPGQDKKLGLTHYQVITGSGTLFQGSEPPSFVLDKPHAALVVEAGKPVIWTKPQDIELPADKSQVPALGGLLKSGTNIMLVGGDVHFFGKQELNASLIWDLIEGKWRRRN